MFTKVDNGPKLETTQMCLNWEWINNEILFNSKKAQTKLIHVKHDEPEIHYAK